MNASDAMRTMIEASGKSGRQVAREIGRSASFVSSSLSQGVCPRADTLALVAHACGYELILVPIHEVERPADIVTNIVIEYEAHDKS